MKNFQFHNPTKIIFGDNTIKSVGIETKRYGEKALMVYGKSSIKKTGIYDIAVKSLTDAGIDIIEFSGVQSNPVLSHVREGVKIAKNNNIDIIVAVGGGSVIDEAKAIAAGAKSDFDVWDFFIDKSKIENALPLITVLTLAATGSEMNDGAVVTNEDTLQKFNINAVSLFPKVSILDPTATFSVPASYTAYSGVDAITHILEGYFTSDDNNTPIQDRFVESIVHTVMESTDKILQKPDDFEARASMMWGATLALNGLTTAGIGNYAFPNHMIEHSLSAIYTIPHGAGLSIVLSGWMKYQYKKNPEKFAQFAKRIFNINGTSEEETAYNGINALIDWFKKINSPTTLSEMNIPAKDIPEIAQNATMLAEKWGLHDYTKEVIHDILTLCK